jgi:hypothetical protein
MATPAGVATSVSDDPVRISPEPHYHQPPKIRGPGAPRGPYAKVVRYTSRWMQDKTDAERPAELGPNKARKAMASSRPVWPRSIQQARRSSHLRIPLVRQATPSHPDAGISSPPACRPPARIVLDLSHHRHLSWASTARRTPSHHHRQIQARLSQIRLANEHNAVAHLAHRPPSKPALHRAAPPSSSEDGRPPTTTAPPPPATAKAVEHGPSHAAQRH